MLRKQVNHNIEHRKSIKILKKKGMTGLLISELNGEVITSAIKGSAKDFDTIYKAMLGVDWLASMCAAVAAPQVTMSQKDSDESVHGEVTDIVSDIVESTESAENEDLQLNG